VPFKRGSAVSNPGPGAAVATASTAFVYPPAAGGTPIKTVGGVTWNRIAPVEE